MQVLQLCDYVGQCVHRGVSFRWFAVSFMCVVFVLPGPLVAAIGHRLAAFRFPKFVVAPVATETGRGSAWHELISAILILTTLHRHSCWLAQFPIVQAILYTRTAQKSMTTMA